MKLIKPFAGLRPRRELAAKVAAHPYDVVNREEATAMAAGNPISFFHINKPEIDLPLSVDPHDQQVYDRGAENLQRFIAEGTMLRDGEEKLYVYKQVMGKHQQVGLVAVASIDAYEKGLIKKHEFTRPEKEDDRVYHMDTLGAQVGPVFLTYRARPEIDRLIAQVTATAPEYDFVAPDGTQHVFWVVDDLGLAADIETAFDQVTCLYVADGHHRSAAAARVKHMRAKCNPAHSGEESYNWFLVVVFPDNQMQILDYNRLVKDLNGRDVEDYMEELEDRFAITPVNSRDAARPKHAHQFGMYLQDNWYLLDIPAGNVNESDPVKSLDVSILQDRLLEPLLGIKDQRLDTRIDFVGGIRGLQELEKRVDSGQWQLAIVLYPTSIASLMSIADAGEVMPPKSTWFEPKLKSGLVVHVLD
ncbi:MAG: DUF1015 family protein [Pseudohongiellaceae bacterium]